MTEVAEERLFRIASGGVTRVVSLAGGSPRTVELVPALGSPLAVASTELQVILDIATWRHDIPVWHWRVAAADAADDTAWADPDLSDTDWRIVPHLHPLLTARAGGAHWFRARVVVPAAHRSAPVDIVLGGLDAQDWGRYEIWLDGLALADRRASGSLREPHRVTLKPGSAAHAALLSPDGALLAVRCTELSREIPGRATGELEHHFFQDWLMDQYLAVGGTTRTISDFRTVTWHPGPGGTSLEVEVEHTGDPSLRAVIRYVADDQVVRKHIRLVNHGTQPLEVLDVVTESWDGAFQPRLGGRGQPLVMGDLFAGIEHPAGVSRTDTGVVRLVQMPGVTIAPGASWDAQPVVLGGGSSGPEAAFRRYVEGVQPRPDRRLTVYSALGWYDFTNPADPLPELTADLVDENLDQLAELQAAGAGFDVYMLDDWWERTDLGSFRRSTFPDGPGAQVERMRAMGMEPGLWWATTRALWSADLAPGLEGSWANDPSHSAMTDLSGGDWQWLQEFTNLFVGERRLCLASEPYRSMYLEAIPRHIGELGARILKLDCVVLHCTSSRHAHRAGRHSMEAMVDSLIELIGLCREASPDVRAIWYWGFRSPWYLRFGEVTFDKGLLMEAATVASSPAPTTRQSLTLNVDQAIRQAPLLPLRLQDSLGVWIGDVAWCNRIGTTEWAEALLVDAARGSDLIQVWGDLTLLDTDDRDMFGAIWPWLERQLDARERTVVLGGDPWRGEAYGYARPADGGTVATLVNPGPTHASIDLGGLVADVPGGLWQAIELYPFPGAVQPPAGTTGTSWLVDLAPWETRLLWVGPADIAVPGIARQSRPSVRASRRLALGGDRIGLPEVGREDAVFLSHRLERDGEWAYDAEPQALISSEVTLDGLAVASTTLPRVRDRNGPGSPWVLHTIPAGPAWSGRALTLRTDDQTPSDVTVHTDAWLVERWWRRYRRRFSDPFHHHP